MKKLVIIILLNFFSFGAVFADCTNNITNILTPLTVYFATRKSHHDIMREGKVILIKRVGNYALYKINRRFARDVYVIYHKNKGIIKRFASFNFGKAVKEFKKLICQSYKEDKNGN